MRHVLVVGVVLAVAAGCGYTSRAASPGAAKLTAAEVSSALEKQGFQVHVQPLSHNPLSNGTVPFLPDTRIVGLVTWTSGRKATSGGRPFAVVFNDATAARNWYGYERGELQKDPTAPHDLSMSVVANVVAVYIPPKPPGTDCTKAFKSAMVQLEGVRPL